MQFVAVKIKQVFCAGFVSFAVISIPFSSLAVKVEQVPNPRQINRGWVTDMAGVLSPSTEAQLNQMISQLEAKNGSEIAVVTVRETSPSATPKQFATTLFNRWGIGKAGKNNGVLLLISTGDRRIEIETGYGVQTILPNSFVGSIIKQEISPRFKQGDYNGGTLAGTKALVVKLETYNPPANLSLHQSSSAQIYGHDWILFVTIAGVILIFVIVFGFFVILFFQIIRGIKQATFSSNCGHSYSGNYPSSGISNTPRHGNSNCTSNSISYRTSHNTIYDTDTSYSSGGNTYVMYDNDSSYSSVSNSYDSSSCSNSGDSTSSSSDFGGGSSGGSGAGDSYDSSYSSDTSSYDSSSCNSDNSSYSSDANTYVTSDNNSSYSSVSNSYDSSSGSSSYDSSSSGDSASSSGDFGGGSSGGSGVGDSYASSYSSDSSSYDSSSSYSSDSSSYDSSSCSSSGDSW